MNTGRTVTEARLFEFDVIPSLASDNVVLNVNNAVKMAVYKCKKKKKKKQQQQKSNSNT